jgi:hypothetical protein
VNDVDVIGIEFGYTACIAEFAYGKEGTVRESVDDVCVSCGIG